MSETKRNTAAEPPDDELRKRLDDNPPKPAILKDGDVVIGDFAKYDKGVSFDYGEFHTAIVANVNVSGMLEPPELQEGDTVSVALFHEALKSAFERLRPKRGDRIAIKRIGKRVSQRSGREFIAWSVVSAEDTGVSEDEVFGPRKPRPDKEDWSTGAFNDPAPF